MKYFLALVLSASMFLAGCAGFGTAEQGLTTYFVATKMVRESSDKQHALMRLGQVARFLAAVEADENVTGSVIDAAFEEYVLVYAKYPEDKAVVRYVKDKLLDGVTLDLPLDAEKRAIAGNIARALHDVIKDFQE
jgi:hypothetical protein